MYIRIMVLIQVLPPAEILVTDAGCAWHNGFTVRGRTLTTMLVVERPSLVFSSESLTGRPRWIPSDLRTEIICDGIPLPLRLVSASTNDQLSLTIYRTDEFPSSGGSVTATITSPSNQLDYRSEPAYVAPQIQ
ncbi:MAG: hypothetical protein L0I24_08055 [Pseudonocardia sp.]|nr:hypothetical protein [Pseudonocardia sp.]